MPQFRQICDTLFEVCESNEDNDMGFFRAGAVVLCCLSAASASASQPISESMVQCAALYGTASDWVQGDSHSARLQRAAGAFVIAAQAQAVQEGKSNPSEYVEDMWGYKNATWGVKGKAYVFTQDFRDWTGYCKALARDRDIALQ